MLPKVLPKEKFAELCEFLLSRGRLVAPVARGPQFAFETIEGGEQIERIRMDYDVTILPPKKCIFPVRQTLLRFSGRSPQGLEAPIEAQPQTILGVHPYDLHAIATLDAAMAAEPADPYYLQQRAATTLIGMNIDRYADDEQFMADMGTLDPPEGGYDLFLTDLGERYYVEVGTQAGSQLAKQSGLFIPAGPDDHKAKQQYDQAKLANCPKKLPYNTKYLPELLEANYDSLLWDAISQRCFSCGTCTNVCPTCYCFDVWDELNLDATSGQRVRRWDSCQLKVFAEVAGGENFREKKSDRVRHRVFRKGKYILERTGRLGCVGCGRCIRHCVASISILDAFQQIADEVVDDRAETIQTARSTNE